MTRVFYPLLLLVLMIMLSSSAVHERHYLSENEKDLYDLIMKYRREKGLGKINLSPSLTYVARLHAKDLDDQRPFDDQCNLHSWSPNGDWTPCCYTDDHKNASCMWFKPFELTGFKGIGYEIVYYSTYPSDHIDFPFSILQGWKESKNHNLMIINRGEWKTLEWKSIGIAINGPFAVVWFSDTEDKSLRLPGKD